jgi:DNA repair exonuclease SbcCD nuclease subunit
MDKLFNKAITIADIHFGRSGNSPIANKDNIEFLKWAIDEAKTFGAETCIMLGDWHDNRHSLHVSTMLSSLEGIDMLNANFKTVWWLIGNHDLLYKDKRDAASIEFSKYLPNIEIIREPTTIDDVTFLPWLIGDESKTLRTSSRYVFSHLELPNFYMNDKIKLEEKEDSLDIKIFNKSEYVFCFPEETTVVSKNGIKPISKIQVGDLVLTHLGNWKPVMSIQTKKSELIELKGNGHPRLRTTIEHPFLSYGTGKCSEDGIPDRKMSDVVNSSNFQWVEANQMTDHWWCSPSMIPIIDNTWLSLPSGIELNDHFCLFLGWYLAEGHTSKGRINLSCHLKEVEEVSKVLKPYFDTTDQTIGQPRKKEVLISETAKNGRQISLFNRNLADWLDTNIGKYSEHKTLPGWVFGLSKSQRENLLSGYIEGDGQHLSSFKWEAKTVSRGIAFGIKILAQTLGWKTTIFYRKEKQQQIFPNGVYDTLPQWHIRAYNDTTRWGSSTIFCDDYLCGRVKKIKKIEGVYDVYNLSVADDNSFVADGIVVHNCGHYHLRQTKDNICYTGNVMPFNFSDDGDTDRGIMFMEYGKEPIFKKWAVQPSYATMKLSDLISNPDRFLKQNMTARVAIDIPLRYEEAQEIRDELVSTYSLRKIELINGKIEEQSFEDKTIEYHSVDQIVVEGLDSIDSSELSKDTLKNIYRNLPR